jgi:2-amino-4-hydroxy-6-hydroxymethyldihydropteridine diphosphokinase
MEAIIGIGSNIRPSENVRKSIGMLAKYTRIRSVSSVYRSPAENRPEQPMFYNCAVMVETALSEGRLRTEVLARIEADLGRVRTGDKFAARTIDLDLLACRGDPGGVPGNAMVGPDILNHPYVALPLAELAPELSVGAGGMSLREAVRTLSQDSIEKLSEFSTTLRREFVCDKDFQ